MSETKRGINLGCGRVILPCARPDHHELIPAWLYERKDIEWHNVDRNQSDGVTHIVNLFDYPWRNETQLEIEAAGGLATLPHVDTLPSNHYDYAIATHIAEHIPHMIVEHGRVVPFHAQYQDGWFYWFSELSRILKPGGQAWVLSPYAWSNGAISDPTHTRYLTPAAFGYLNPNDDSPFAYAQGGAWVQIDFGRDMGIRGHLLGNRRVDTNIAALSSLSATLTAHLALLDAEMINTETRQRMQWEFAQEYLNQITEFCIRLVKAGGNDAGAETGRESGRTDKRDHADTPASAEIAQAAVG